VAARIADWVSALDSLYDPAWAADWDAVGLVCGDPDGEATEALFAVDCVEATVDDAVRRGVHLLVTHHPLLLRPVHGVPSAFVCATKSAMSLRRRRSSSLAL
jgi:putative NIF3 family GTP cyclohydrolase 1 type 2